MTVTTAMERAVVIKKDFASTLIIDFWL